MGLSINQNIAAVNSYRNLSNTQNDLSQVAGEAVQSVSGSTARRTTLLVSPSPRACARRSAV